MATISQEQSYPIQGNNTTILTSWTALTTTNVDGAPFTLAGYKDRSVQVVGTFGVGGTCVIQGSNDGTTYATLTDPQGNALSFSSAGLEAVSELVLYLRPYITGGDGTTDLDVFLIAGK